MPVDSDDSPFFVLDDYEEIRPTGGRSLKKTRKK